MKTIYALEKIRLMLLILSFLLMDNFSFSSATEGPNGPAGTGGQSSRSAGYTITTKSNDLANINIWILEAIAQEPSTRFMILECFRFISMIYNYMIELLALETVRGGDRHPCVSPYLLQTILYFYSELFTTYLAPSLENYDIQIVERFPFIQGFLSNGKPSLPSDCRKY